MRSLLVKLFSFPCLAIAAPSFLQLRLHKRGGEGIEGEYAGKVSIAPSLEEEEGCGRMQKEEGEGGFSRKERHAAKEKKLKGKPGGMGSGMKERGA